MNWIILLFALELGYAPTYMSQNVIPPTTTILDVTEDIGYVLMDAEVVLWDTLFIGGYVKTYIQGSERITTFYPFESDYGFSTGLRFDIIEVGWRHGCAHPTRPYETYFNHANSSNGFYNEYYIRIEYKLK